MTDTPRRRPATPDGVTVRHADPDDLLGVVRVLDAAALATDADAIRARLRREPPRVFVAVAGAEVNGRESKHRDASTATPEDGRSNTDPEHGGTGRIVGALVFVGQGRSRIDSGDVWIENVAVRRRRRGKGIGRALVDAACEFAVEQAPADATPRVLAAFERPLRPFYEACGFDIADGIGDLEGKTGGFQDVEGGDEIEILSPDRDNRLVGRRLCAPESRSF